MTVAREAAGEQPQPSSGRSDAEFMGLMLESLALAGAQGKPCLLPLYLQFGLQPLSLVLETASYEHREAFLFRRGELLLQVLGLTLSAIEEKYRDPKYQARLNIAVERCGFLVFDVLTLCIKGPNRMLLSGEDGGLNVVHNTNPTVYPALHCHGGCIHA